MAVYQTHSEEETMALGVQIAQELSAGGVVAMFGGLGMGKTAFVRGMARVLAPDAAVTSPTFALVNEYGGDPPLFHFDMYRVEGWEDLYSTGFFDYLNFRAVLAIEWSENIEGALPVGSYLVEFERLGDSDRQITITRKTEEDVL